MELLFSRLCRRIRVGPEFSSKLIAERELMRLPAVLVSIGLILPGMAVAKSCDEMTKDLARLRVEYHEFVSGPSAQNANVSFEELTEKLDKIIDLKNEMRKASCEIPARPKKFKKKR